MIRIAIADDLDMIRSRSTEGFASSVSLNDFSLGTWLPDDVTSSFTPWNSSDPTFLGYDLDPEAEFYSAGPFANPDYNNPGWYFITDEGNLYLHFESS